MCGKGGNCFVNFSFFPDARVRREEIASDFFIHSKIKLQTDRTWLAPLIRFALIDYGRLREHTVRCFHLADLLNTPFRSARDESTAAFVTPDRDLDIAIRDSKRDFQWGSDNLSAVIKQPLSNGQTPTAAITKLCVARIVSAECDKCSIPRITLFNRKSVLCSFHFFLFYGSYCFRRDKIDPRLCILHYPRGLAGLLSSRSRSRQWHVLLLLAPHFSDVNDYIGEYVIYVFAMYSLEENYDLETHRFFWRIYGTIFNSSLVTRFNNLYTRN